MINISLVSIRFILCVFFLQSLLVYSSQSLGKTNQSHPSSAHGHKPAKKQANSSKTSGRSGGCHKSCEKNSGNRNKKQAGIAPVHEIRSKVVLVSYYNLSGKRTANQERFRTNALTAAHRTLPFGTIVRVTNLKNGKSVEVRINDRGPHVRSRDIDLSKGAARSIGLTWENGVIQAKMEIVSLPKTSGA